MSSSIKGLELTGRWRFASAGRRFFFGLVAAPNLSLSSTDQGGGKRRGPGLDILTGRDARIPKCRLLNLEAPKVAELAALAPP